MISNFSAIAYLQDEVNRRVAERLPEYLLTMPSEKDQEDSFVAWIEELLSYLRNYPFMAIPSFESKYFASIIGHNVIYFRASNRGLGNFSLTTIQIGKCNDEDKLFTAFPIYKRFRKHLFLSSVPSNNHKQNEDIREYYREISEMKYYDYI